MNLNAIITTSKGKIISKADNNWIKFQLQNAQHDIIFERTFTADKKYTEYYCQDCDFVAHSGISTCPSCFKGMSLYIEN